MSFILEALKKSESERQRQSGPALFEVKVAPPRSRFALWISILGALLLINVIGVGWMLLRGSAPRSGATSTVASPVPVPAAGLGGVVSARAPGLGPRSAAVAPVPATASPLPSREPTPGALTTPPAAESAEAPPPAAATEAARNANAEDLAPAVEPPRGASDGVVRGTASGLPTYQDAAAVPGANIPELRLDLHSYSARPDERFVFVNMTKLHEGDSLPQGVRVEAITPEGVILSYQGTKFILQHQ
ncbi:MAG TPA: general secretion pathway protein GspB [Steroidobacteraceae bacterium]|nr:general secretion pathway protein GspB [Steroidobacteraceae bacterium]